MIAALVILTAFLSSPTEADNEYLRRAIAVKNNQIEYLEWRLRISEEELSRLKREAATQPVK
jgi:hypothetical protein